jgi:hypothetical protein
VGAALLLQYEMLADVAYGSKADMAAQILMSAIIPKADIATAIHPVGEMRVVVG